MEIFDKSVGFIGRRPFFTGVYPVEMMRTHDAAALDLPKRDLFVFRLGDKQKKKNY